MVVPPAGIEPAAYCLGGSRSIQLSYEDTKSFSILRAERCQGKKLAAGTAIEAVSPELVMLQQNGTM